MANAPKTIDAEPKRAVPPPSGIAEARGAAADLVRRTASGMENNPIALVAGGLALGAVLGALLPRSERERQLLAPVGGKLEATLTAAIGAAREAGQAELDSLGLNRDNAREQARTLIEGLVRAASSAGGAAMSAATGAAATAPVASGKTVD